MKHFLLLIALTLLVAGCALPTQAPQPTYTPLPTYTPYPTFTPPAPAGNLPTARPINTATPRAITSSSASAQPTTAGSSCIAWQDAAMHMNETKCVRGVVYSTNQSGSTFFINFDNTRTSFYGVSFKYTWDNLKGKCIELHGKITPYNGRPQIILDKQDQLKMCQ